MTSTLAKSKICYFSSNTNLKSKKNCSYLFTIFQMKYLHITTWKAKKLLTLYQNEFSKIQECEIIKDICNLNLDFPIMRSLTRQKGLLPLSWYDIRKKNFNLNCFRWWETKKKSILENNSCWIRNWKKKIPSKKRKIGDHFHGEKLLNCEFLLLLAASTTTILLLQITHKYFHENSIIHVWKMRLQHIKNRLKTFTNNKAITFQFYFEMKNLQIIHK